MAEKRVDGFIPLKTVSKGAPAPEEALAEIRRIYFQTNRRTIEHDLAHAIELLKGIPSEELREKAAVFMEGLADMRRDWQKQDKRKPEAPASPRPSRRRPRRTD